MPQEKRSLKKPLPKSDSSSVPSISRIEPLLSGAAESYRKTVPVGRALPTGTVTFLFTDIEGSTPLWERAPDAMEAALQIHNSMLHQAIAIHGGVVFKIIGDEFNAAFPTASQALSAAVEIQRRLSSADWSGMEPLRVRMGIHTGEAHLDPSGDGYAVSLTTTRTSRVMTAGHGGQVLLSQESADLCARALPQGVILKDLGAHRLKGLSNPERLFQAMAPGLRVDFPPLRALDIFPNNLPVQLTSFIGRGQECSEVRRLLGQARLLTLSGVGGTGKTRLALHLAAKMLEEFEHGVWLVELARLTDPALVLPAVAAVFGFYEDKAGMSLEARLLNYLQGQRLLLILDNCEHLIVEVARLADALLRAVPGLKILATSRETLGLIGETTYQVPSMMVPSRAARSTAEPDPEHLPSLGALMEYDAVRLFIERAAAVHPTFALTESNALEVAQICHRLDGIPLAIELAAARIKTLSTQQILARLDQRFRLLTGGSRTAMPRHQTLRAAIDWSFELLSEAEQALLTMLSVFIGGWSLEAAEAVCECEAPWEGEVLDLLTQLVNKSLVQAELADGEVRRYRMLETVRQYTGEYLAKASLNGESLAGESLAGEMQDKADQVTLIRNRHLDYYLALSEEFFRTVKKLAGYGQSRSLYVEIDNFRAALDWAFGSDDPETFIKGLWLTCNLLNFWVYLDLSAEGLAWTRKGLARLEKENEHLSLLRARACFCAADLSNRVDNNRDVCLYARQSVNLYRRFDDPCGLILAMDTLANSVGYLEPDHPLAVSASEARALREEIEIIHLHGRDPLCMYVILKSKIYQAIADKKYDLAASLTGEYRHLFKGTIMEEDEHWFLAGIARSEGDFARALYHYKKLLDYWRRINNKGNIAYVSILVGDIVLEQQEADQAQVYYQDAMVLAQEIGAKWQFSYALRKLARISLSKREYQQVGAYLLLGLTLAPEMDPEILIKNCLLPLLNAAAEIAQPSKMACLLGFVENQRDFFMKSERARAQYEHVKAVLQTCSDEPAFKTGYQVGRSMSLEQVIGEARLLAKELAEYQPV
jgi:predicted ATPase/class 3 adenylate cyclase